MADKSGKTEQPTQRRLQKAREEGQFPSAREFVAALQFMVFLSLLGVGGAHWFAQFRQTTRLLLAQAFTREFGTTELLHIAWLLFWQHLLPLAMGGMAVAVATVGIRLVTTRFGLSLKRLVPDPQRFNILSRLRELPRQNLPSLVQAMVLLPVFLWAVYALARDKLEVVLALPLAGV
jgi:flagellar biosynthesis protein FlhB